MNSKVKEVEPFAISKIGNNYNQFMLFDDAVLDSTRSGPIAIVQRGEYVNILAAAPLMLDALIMVLPYVETVSEEGYKPGVVNKMVRQIRDAIRAADPEGGQ